MILGCRKLLYPDAANQRITDILSTPEAEKGAATRDTPRRESSAA
jgi:hypothetical protein